MGVPTRAPPFPTETSLFFVHFFLAAVLPSFPPLVRFPRGAVPRRVPVAAWAVAPTPPPPLKQGHHPCDDQAYGTGAPVVTARHVARPPPRPHARTAATALAHLVTGRTRLVSARAPGHSGAHLVIAGRRGGRSGGPTGRQRAAASRGGVRPPPAAASRSARLFPTPPPARARGACAAAAAADTGPTPPGLMIGHGGAPVATGECPPMRVAQPQHPRIHPFPPIPSRPRAHTRCMYGHIEQGHPAPAGPPRRSRGPARAAPPPTAPCRGHL